MTTEVLMPAMGADMTEGTLVRWFKQVGEEVRRGEIIAEIETDKANVELEAFESGTILKHLAGEGDVVPVGEAIALLGDPGEQVDGATPAGSAARQADKGLAAATAAREPGAAAPPGQLPGADGRAESVGSGRTRISPVARQIAGEAGLDLAGMAGTGPGGRILRRDVELAIARRGETARTPPAPQAPTRAAAAPAGATGFSKIRQAIARRMALSKQTQPHYYLTLDIDMSAAMKFREEINRAASEAQRVSVNDLIVKACAIALARHPKFNAEFAESGIALHEAINIDIAIALDDGLIAPALMDCQGKSLGRIAEESKDLAARAKAGRLRASEYSEGTFTVTNLGAYGVETLIGIINPPQAAILGVGSVMARPVVRDGQVVASQVMKVALSADHRVTDGAEGARFIKEIQGLLENPSSLAL